MALLLPALCVTKNLRLAARMVLGTGIKLGISLVFATCYKNVFAFKSNQACHMIVLPRYFKENLSADQLL